MKRLLILGIALLAIFCSPETNKGDDNSYVLYQDHIGKPSLLPERVVGQDWVHYTDMIGESYRSDKNVLHRIVKFTHWEPYKNSIIPIMGTHTYDMETDNTIHKYYAYTMVGSAICLYEMLPGHPCFIKPNTKMCSIFTYSRSNNSITYNESQYLSTRQFAHVDAQGKRK